jgi:hypothetical protein
MNDKAEAIPDDVATDRGGLVKEICFRCQKPIADPVTWMENDDGNFPFHAACAEGAWPLSERPKEEKPMGYSARQNETARKAAAGELHSRRTIIGAMDHALEIHASALRLLEAKIVALSERVEKLERVEAIARERADKLYQPPVALNPALKSIIDEHHAADHD